jgi:hypothetical protein
MRNPKGPYKGPSSKGTPSGNPAQRNTRKIAMPKNMLGKTAKKPENDDRPLKHGRTAKQHKRAQRLDQQKL